MAIAARTPRRRVPVNTDALRAARLAAGMSQGRLAAKADVSHNTISRIERGAHREANVNTLRRVARVLHVPLADLIGHPDG